MSRKEDLRRLFHHFHPFYEFLNDTTRIYYVGPKIDFVQHSCVSYFCGSKALSIQQTRAVVQGSAAPVKSRYLALLAPSHSIKPAVACIGCNMVWVGEDPPEDKHVE